MELAFSWAFVSAGVVAVVWLRLHYQSRSQSLHSPKLKALEDQAEALNADLQSVYDELSDKIELVNERMDFAERLLSQPRNGVEEREETPEAVTPV